MRFFLFFVIFSLGIYIGHLSLHDKILSSFFIKNSLQDKNAPVFPLRKNGDSSQTIFDDTNRIYPAYNSHSILWENYTHAFEEFGLTPTFKKNVFFPTKSLCEQISVIQSQQQHSFVSNSGDIPCKQEQDIKNISLLALPLPKGQILFSFLGNTTNPLHHPETLFSFVYNQTTKKSFLFDTPLSGDIYLIHNTLYFLDPFFGTLQDAYSLSMQTSLSKMVKRVPNTNLFSNISHTTWIHEHQNQYALYSLDFSSSVYIGKLPQYLQEFVGNKIIPWQFLETSNNMYAFFIPSSTCKKEEKKLCTGKIVFADLHASSLKTPQVYPVKYYESSDICGSHSLLSLHSSQIITHGKCPYVLQKTVFDTASGTFLSRELLKFPSSPSSPPLPRLTDHPPHNNIDDAYLGG